MPLNYSHIFASIDFNANKVIVTRFANRTMELHLFRFCRPHVSCHFWTFYCEIYIIVLACSSVAHRTNCRWVKRLPATFCAAAHMNQCCLLPLRLTETKKNIWVFFAEERFKNLLRQLDRCWAPHPLFNHTWHVFLSLSLKINRIGYHVQVPFTPFDNGWIELIELKWTEVKQMS